MDGRAEAKIVGLSMTALYAFIVIAGWITA